MVFVHSDYTPMGGERSGSCLHPLDCTQGAIFKGNYFFPTLICCLLSLRKLFSCAHFSEEMQMNSYNALTWLGNTAKHIYIL